jgi:hypothetical protein
MLGGIIWTNKNVMESASDQCDVGCKKESVFEYIHEQLAPLKLLTPIAKR